MLFTLAAELGMPVSELEERVSSRELTEWIAYQRVAGPIGPARADALTAYLVQQMYASSGNLKKGAKPPSMDKLMPQWGKGNDKAEERTPEQQRDAFFSAIARSAPKEKSK